VTTKKRGPLSGYGYLPPGGVAGDLLTKENDIDGQAIWQAATLAVEYIRVGRSTADGSEANAAANSDAIDAALQAASDVEGARVVLEHGHFKIDRPIVLDSRDLTLIGDGATISGGANCRTLIASFASQDTEDHSDLDANSGLLGGAGLRTNVPGSLEDVRITGIKFEPGSATRAIHITGFTRGCEIDHCQFTGFSEYDILLNGSWSFSLTKNRCQGTNDAGTGIALGIAGEGERSGTRVCNSMAVIGNWSGNHSTGARYQFGVGGSWTGNTFEFNAASGFVSQSAGGFFYGGNYHEQNRGNNIQLGGTNGADYVEGAVFRGNYLAAFTSVGGGNFRLNATRNCIFGPNQFSDSPNARTQQYFIGSALNTGNEIWVPANSGTYIQQLSSLDQSVNRLVLTASLAKPTVRGSRGGNTAVTDLLTQMATLNMIVDGTSA
jgi:hypothetical protein